MINSKYRIEKMDCPAEEQMIRSELEDLEGIARLEFDLAERQLEVFHHTDADLISERLASLDLGSEFIESEKTENTGESKKEQTDAAPYLWAVLVINFVFFIVEMTAGLLSGSMGLVGDSLDMFADSTVYGLSLLAIGKALSTKKLVARLAGYFQFILAILGFSEVLRRVLTDSEPPEFKTMIIVASLALVANVVCLYILQKSENREAHMKASMIFTSNDIIINGGVITAGILVNLLNSQIPDLVVGAIVFGVVIRGSFRILKLAK
ncbi:MAG: cation transporter [bacterium]